MNFKSAKELESYVHNELGIYADVINAKDIYEGRLVGEKLQIDYGPTIESIIDKKIEALEKGSFDKARVAQEIYSEYCGVDKDSGAYSLKQEQRLVDATNSALQRLNNELRDTSWRNIDEKRQLLSQCENFLATVDGIKQTDSIDLTEFKEKTGRLKESIPPEKKKEQRKETELQNADREEKNVDLDQKLGMENIPAHERDEAEDIKKETVQEEQEKDLPDEKKDTLVNSRMVKIDAYESMYEKAKHKIRELFNKIKNAIMPKTQENEKDMDDDGR